jgi:hypothetical protein
LKELDESGAAARVIQAQLSVIVWEKVLGIKVFFLVRGDSLGHAARVDG